MTKMTFDEIVDEQLARSRALLILKGQEYGTGEDRLASFKKAGALMNMSEAEAALGMLAKHLVSVTEMIQSRQHFTTDRWNEKITDSINYLLIIRAIVEEDAAV